MHDEFRFPGSTFQKDIYSIWLTTYNGIPIDLLCIIWKGYSTAPHHVVCDNAFWLYKIVYQIWITQLFEKGWRMGGG